MRVNCITARELDATLIATWERIYCSHSAYSSPYFSPQFTLSVAKARADVRVAVIEHSGVVSGFFPFHLGRGGRGRPIGLGFSDFHGPIIGPGVDVCPVDLLRSCGLSVYEFDHLLASQSAFRPFAAEADVSPIMDLSKGYTAYAAEVRALGSKQILKAEGLLRKLEREVGRVRFEARGDSDDTFDALRNWKGMAYPNFARVFRIPWVRNFLDEIRRAKGRTFSGAVSTLWAGDRLLAAHLGMLSNRAWHYWLPGYDAAMEKYSPGIILLLKMAAAAPSMWLVRIDLGKGMSQYKQRLMNGGVSLVEGRVEVPCLKTSFRRGQRQLEEWARRSRVGSLARIPGRLVKKWARRSRFT